jgi:hypothetical protein
MNLHADIIALLRFGVETVRWLILDSAARGLGCTQQGFIEYFMLAGICVYVHLSVCLRLLFGSPSATSARAASHNTAGANIKVSLKFRSDPLDLRFGTLSTLPEADMRASILTFSPPGPG